MSSEPDNYVQAMRPLLALYKRLPAVEFSPLKLKAVQGEMVKLEWCRSNINKQTSRIRTVFKWAAGNELIPPSVYHGLEAVSGLRIGRSEAKESEPVLPVPMPHVTAVLPHVSRQVAGMIQLQLLTGMRPGEVCMMRTADIDTTGPLWLYKPQHHKTEHHGHDRKVYLGPRAIEVIKPFLKTDLQAYLFDPRDAEKDRRQIQHEQRKTPASCGNSPGTNRKAKPKRTPGDHYEVDAYRRCIARACATAGIPCWHPHQLRHTAATELRKTHGLEAAQVILGHRTLTVTQVYAEKNVAEAQRVMSLVG